MQCRNAAQRSADFLKSLKNVLSMYEHAVIKTVFKNMQQRAVT